jgi:hypothetical protein
MITVSILIDGHAEHSRRMDFEGETFADALAKASEYMDSLVPLEAKEEEAEPGQ